MPDSTAPLAALAVLTLVTALFVTLAVTRPNAAAEGAYFEPAPLAISGGTAATPPPAPTTAEGRLALELTAALTTPAWPELTPALDELGKEARVPEWWQDGCLAQDKALMGDPVANAEHCVYGDAAATKTAVVLGDSVAISYVPGIRAALEPLGYQVKVHTMAQCPVGDVPVMKVDGSAHDQCDVFRAWALEDRKSVV